MSLKKNILANYLGQGWSAIMALAFIPVYIRYLGMEAYGLIGLFAVVQAWMTLLDMGMTPTLNREMARYTAGAHSPQSIRDLLRSLEVLCFTIAALIGLGVWAASGYLAGDWLQSQQLPNEVVAQALAIMAVVVALRFVEGIYRGSLFGLQQQVSYNVASAILATVRHGGSALILALIAPTVQAFFLWQAGMSILTVAVFAVGVHKSLPRSPAPPRFSREAIEGVWKFASGMVGITFLSLLLTQVDKVLLSRMLTLTNFGYYTLAATVAGAILMMISPITQALFPRLVELSSNGDQAALISVYHQGAQLVSVFTAPLVMLLTFFAEGVIFAWSGDTELARNTSPILSALALGTFLNGLMWVPYQCQLAHGWTSLAIKTNVIAVLLLIPAIFWVVPRNGAVGAAWMWVALNAGYVLIAIKFMHRRLIPNEKWRWYIFDLVLPISGAVAVMALARFVQPTGYVDRWHWLLFLVMAGGVALLAAGTLADRLRDRLFAIIEQRMR